MVLRRRLAPGFPAKAGDKPNPTSTLNPWFHPVMGPGVFHFCELLLFSRRRMIKPKLKQPLLVMTIGHSNRPLETFIQFLQAHEVKRVIDVRTIPRSRHNPQFNKDSLPGDLRAAKIFYRHMPGLGGLRHARRDSINAGWRSPSFRGYADYMQTKEFNVSLKALMKLAKQKQIALMCAEAVPWRCHRSLIADALVVHGVPVEHIITRTFRRPHTLTPFARLKGKRISYPPEMAGVPAPAATLARD